MSVYRRPNSPHYHYDFQLKGHRFCGTTNCTSRREAEAVEAQEAKALVKAAARSRTSLLIDDVADRLWEQPAKHDAASDATETNLARLIEYFGKAKPLTEIDTAEARKLVAWRRGHRIKGTRRRTVVSNATVNRSVTKVLQRLFSFAKGEGAVFEREPKWDEVLLPEPVERVRELQNAEADALDAAMRDDYQPFFTFARTTSLRLAECVTLSWSEVSTSAPSRSCASARAAGA